MKHRKMVTSLLLIAVLTEAVGAVLNRIVASLNGGMPTIALVRAFGKWVPLNQETKLAFLSDVIRVGAYALSVGDLFIIIGMVTFMATLWIAMPQGRKFLPLLIATVFGIFLSTAEANHMTLTLLCEIAAVGTVLAMYRKYRSSVKTKAAVKDNLEG